MQEKISMNRGRRTEYLLFGMKWMLCVTLCIFLGCAKGGEKSRYLQDNAGLLGPAQWQRIVELHHRLYKDLDIHFMAVTLAESPGDLAGEAVSVFDRCAIGKETKGAKGLLFLIDPVGKAVRLEVGYDLEGIFTDAFVGYIEGAQMKPFFEAGKVAEGIEATCELLVSKAMAAGTPGVTGRGTSNAHLSGGAGADIKVGINSGVPEKDVVPDKAEFCAQASPLMTLKIYKSVLRKHIKDPELGIYTPASREFFKNWLVTDAQQNNELSNLERMMPEASVKTRGDKAVIRFPVSERQASPYLLRTGEGGWQLDVAFMNQLIGFNHKNQWFFRTAAHEFDFAFADLHFDAHGFPHEKK